MISIIISSHKENFYNKVIKNIAETIGTDYEIIKIENPGLFGLTTAYNLGAARANFEILCFIHEDIKFHTQNWGRNLIIHFNKNEKLGLIGIAGSLKKLHVPTGWGYHDKKFNKINIVHRDEQGHKYVLSTHKEQNEDNVKVIDGVFMACKKAIWEKIKFDETIAGYHIYDIDFSLRVSQYYVIVVVYDLLIEHFSHGNFGDDWILATLNYHQMNDKLQLFDKLERGEKLRRLPYYVLLAKNSVSFKMKIKYLVHLGLDFKSIPAVLWFFFPKTGDFFYKIYKKHFPSENISSIKTLNLD